MTQQPIQQRHRQSKAGIAALGLCILSVACVVLRQLGEPFAQPLRIEPGEWRLDLVVDWVQLGAGLLSIGFGLHGFLQQTHKRGFAAVALAASVTLLVTKWATPLVTKWVLEWAFER